MTPATAGKAEASRGKFTLSKRSGEPISRGLGDGAGTGAIENLPTNCREGKRTPNERPFSSQRTRGGCLPHYG